MTYAYIVRVKSSGCYMTIEPTLNPEYNDGPVHFAWTDVKGEAVRFTTRWHARAVAKARKGCVVVRVSL